MWGDYRESLYIIRCNKRNIFYFLFFFNPCYLMFRIVYTTTVPKCVRRFLLFKDSSSMLHIKETEDSSLLMYMVS